MRRTQQNIYVVIKEDSVECYSNLTKVVNNVPNLTYSPLYRAFKKGYEAIRNGHRVVKTKLK